MIIGDANLAEISTYLKVGTTALVLAMIEDRFITADLTIDGRWRRCARSPTTRRCASRSTLNDGRRLTALQLQGEYLELARKYVDDRLGSDADAQTVDVLDRWESVLTRLAHRPDALRARAGLGGEAEAARLLPRPRRPRLGRRQAAS